MGKPTSPQAWSPTPDAFRSLLSWLDQGADSGGERYLEMHRRLVAYFLRKNCLTPDDLADETLTRVSKRLEESDTGIDLPPSQYCYITARYVFLEYRRKAEHKQVPIDEQSRSSAVLEALATPAVQGIDDEQAERLRKLEHCLGCLEAGQQELIREYYLGEQRQKIERRRTMAERMGVSMNALSIRACRIRDKLEACLKASMERT